MFQLIIELANNFLFNYAEEINAIQTEKRNNKNSEINLYPSSHQALSPGNAILLLKKVNFVQRGL